MYGETCQPFECWKISSPGSRRMMMCWEEWFVHHVSVKERPYPSWWEEEEEGEDEEDRAQNEPGVSWSVEMG